MASHRTGALPLVCCLGKRCEGRQRLPSSCCEMEKTKKGSGNDASNTKKLLPQRASRGKRIQALIDDEEAQADEEFWKQDFFAEDQADVDFKSEEEVEEADVVDSDFDDSVRTYGTPLQPCPPADPLPACLPLLALLAERPGCWCRKMMTTMARQTRRLRGPGAAACFVCVCVCVCVCAVP